jgi:hypothetical protein
MYIPGVTAATRSDDPASGQQGAGAGGRPVTTTDAGRDDSRPSRRDARAVAAAAERSGMDILAVLLALVVFGLMLGLIRALERI